MIGINELKVTRPSRVSTLVSPESRMPSTDRRRRTCDFLFQPVYSGLSAHGSGLEDWRVVTESFLTEFFHQLNGNQGDVMLTGMFFNAFFHHGTQEIGNPVESCF